MKYAKNIGVRRDGSLHVRRDPAPKAKKRNNMNKLKQLWLDIRNR